jgi:hypothetical protein
MNGNRPGMRCGSRRNGRRLGRRTGRGGPAFPVLLLLRVRPHFRRRRSVSINAPVKSRPMAPAREPGSISGIAPPPRGGVSGGGVTDGGGISPGGGPPPPGAASPVPPPPPPPLPPPPLPPPPPCVGGTVGGGFDGKKALAVWANTRTPSKTGATDRHHPIRWNTRCFARRSRIMRAPRRLRRRQQVGGPCSGIPFARPRAPSFVSRPIGSMSPMPQP